MYAGEHEYVVCDTPLFLTVKLEIICENKQTEHRKINYNTPVVRNNMESLRGMY